MPNITVEGFGTFEVAANKRLVNALEDNGVDILHRCGGYARCTTCRVEFQSGEPSRITKAEQEKLQESNLLGEVRLSCQIECEHDMELRVVHTLAESGLPDPGPEPEATITPEPAWQERS